MLKIMGLMTAFCALMAAPALAETPAELQPSGRFSAPESTMAQTPTMGWNPWNAFRTEVTEAKIMGVANALISTGLTEAGYHYINLDDGWWLKRRSDGRIEIRTNVFPSAALPDGETSFRPFVDRLHGMGLKVGIYSDSGRNTCAQVYDRKSPNLPEGTVAEREVGSLDYQAQDMQLIFGEWGFDFIKVDACGLTNYGPQDAHVQDGSYRATGPYIFSKQPERTDAAKVESLYASLKNHIQAVRPEGDYILSICLWGQADVNEWGRQYGNSWRTSPDIRPRWDAMLRNFDSAAPLALYAGPGHWNDPDMLEFGNGEFDASHLTEARAHMSMWAVIAAPLILGSDVTQWPQSLIDIAGNRDVIAINQDAAGHQGVTLMKTADTQVVAKTLSDGSKAVALINRTNAPLSLSVPLARLNLDDGHDLRVRDVWTQTDLTPVREILTAELAAHETALYRVSGTPLLKNGVYLSEIPAHIHVAVDGRKGQRLPAGWIAAQVNVSSSGAPLGLGGQVFEDGLGVLANSRLEIRLDKAFSRFQTSAGAVGATSHPVTYRLYGDGRLLAEQTTTGLTTFDTEVTGVSVLELVTEADVSDTPLELGWGAPRLIR